MDVWSILELPSNILKIFSSLIVLGTIFKLNLFQLEPLGGGVDKTYGGAAPFLIALPGELPISLRYLHAPSREPRSVVISERFRVEWWRAPGKELRVSWLTNVGDSEVTCMYKFQS